MGASYEPPVVPADPTPIIAQPIIEQVAEATSADKYSDDGLSYILT